MIILRHLHQSPLDISPFVYGVSVDIGSNFMQQFLINCNPATSIFVSSPVTAFLCKTYQFPERARTKHQREEENIIKAVQEREGFLCQILINKA